jgi:SAM-dependent methyltransferase
VDEGARTGGLVHNQVCNLEDFSHPRLEPVIREVFAHEVGRFGAAFPTGWEDRKHWEAAMAVVAFRDSGLLDGDSELLGVASGNEPLGFFLTRFARRVFVTDRYLDSREWEVFGHASMLTDPGAHWPFEWNPRRLVVQHMDALDLQYEDESFDGVFSSSSIEHFGDHGAISRSMDEMFRVLRPGGVCAVSTEFRMEGPPPGPVGCVLFSAEELVSCLVGDRGWQLTSPLDLGVSEATRRSEVDVRGVVAEQLEQCRRDGGWYSHKLEYSHYPHIVMRLDGHLFTSVHLALKKDEPQPSRQR